VRMPSVWDKLTRHKHFVGLRKATITFLVFIMLLAIILIGVGSGGIQTLSGYDTILKVTVPAGVIVLGLFLFFSTVLGLVGIAKQNAKIFAGYLFILFILIICQFGVGGGAYTWRDQIGPQLEAAWRAASDNDRNNLQQFLQCCGWANNTDAPGSNCLAPNITSTLYATTGFGTTSFPTTANPTTALATTGFITTANPTTSLPTTSSSTTGVTTLAATSASTPSSTTSVSSSASSASSTAVSNTGQGTNQSSSSPQALFKRQDGYDTNVVVTTGFILPNYTDAPCGQNIVLGAQNALYYVASVEVAFSVIQLVGLFVGLALAVWILVQAGKQKFNKLEEEETGEKFTREEFKGDKSDDEDDDDGMSEPPPKGADGKRKIVVNFGN